MYAIIERHYDDEIIKIHKFREYIEAYEFLEFKKENKPINYYIHNVKRDENGFLIYVSFRHKSFKKLYYSLSLIKLPKDKALQDMLTSNELFGELQRGRKHNVVLRVNEEELKELKSWAEDLDVKVTDIIRTAVKEYYERTRHTKENN